jgi:hypothetical protein
LQRKRLKNNNNPELGSERENTSKPRKAPNSEEEGKKEGLTNKPLPLLWSSFSP